MKTELIFVGKTVDKRFDTAIDDYIKRIEHYLPIKLTTIPALKNTKNLSEEQQKTAEGELILRQVQSGDTLVLCDERGKEMRSIEFAQWFESLQQRSRKLILVIGGPYGFSKAVYDRADGLISLSRMTFSHQWYVLFWQNKFIVPAQSLKASLIIMNKPTCYQPA